MAEGAFGMRCPRCREALAAVSSAEWCFFRCATCNGCAATIALLRRVAPQRAKDLWLDLPDGAPGDPCPGCARPLATVEVAVSGGGAIHVDACRRCQILWFDAKEIERFADSPAPDAAGVFSALDPTDPPEVRRALAMAKIEEQRLDAQVVDASRQTAFKVYALSRLVSALMRSIR